MTIKKSSLSPYGLNRMPAQTQTLTSQWRKQKTKYVETEILKPESFLPVTTGSTGRSPICFSIKSVPKSHIDGANIFIETTFAIEKYNQIKAKWVATTSDDLVMPIANTYCSLFEDINVSINGNLVENTQRDFTIKAYLQSLLFSLPSDRDTWMQSGLLGIDDGNAFSLVRKADLELYASSPYVYRRARTNDGTKKHVVYGKLISDILNCDSPLPDNVNITVKLFPAKSEACLVRSQADTTQYRIVISDSTLYVPRVHMEAKQQSDHRFTYTNWKTLAYTHQKGQKIFRKDIAVGEQLPQKAMVVFVPEDAYNGSWNTSKLDFKSANVSNILMKCNQRHVPFMNGYKCDWENDIFHTAYVGLTTELGALAHPILYDQFDDGFCIFGFDLTENKIGNLIEDEPKRGALELDVIFNPAPTDNMMVLVVLIYADHFVITKGGTYKTDA